MIEPKLKNKIVLISGANHGIGAATAKEFAKQGAKVFITYFREKCQYSTNELNAAEEKNIGCDQLYRAKQQKTAESVLGYISEIDGEAYSIETDFEDVNSIKYVFDLCEDKLGPVDILINNHTYCLLETFDPENVTPEINGINLLSKEGIDKHFDINTRSYALLMAEYFTRYIKRNATCGRIINVSTDAAHAHKNNISYAASKHAIESYSRSAAIEMGKYGITVNIVSPGPIQTGYIEPEMEKEIINGTPLGRLGLAKDVADVIIFLSSEQSRWLTGQLIYVGGGWRMQQ